MIKIVNRTCQMDLIMSCFCGLVLLLAIISQRFYVWDLSFLLLHNSVTYSKLICHKGECSHAFSHLFREIPLICLAANCCQRASYRVYFRETFDHLCRSTLTELLTQMNDGYIHSQKRPFPKKWISGFRTGSVALSIICEVSWTKQSRLLGGRGRDLSKNWVDHVKLMDQLP